MLCTEGDVIGSQIDAKDQKGSDYFSIMWSVGFTIWSQAATLVCLTAMRRIPIFSIILRGGRGRVRISLELICFDFDTIEIYLS